MILVMARNDFSGIQGGFWSSVSKCARERSELCQLQPWLRRRRLARVISTRLAALSWMKPDEDYMDPFINPGKGS